MIDAKYSRFCFIIELNERNSVKDDVDMNISLCSWVQDFVKETIDIHKFSAVD